MTTYSTYEAKARFSEILRKVRDGQRVTISYRGEEVAEIRPIGTAADSAERRIAELEEAGIVTAGDPDAPIVPLTRRPGALKRFLESRE